MLDVQDKVYKERQLACNGDERLLYKLHDKHIREYQKANTSTLKMSPNKPPYKLITVPTWYFKRKDFKLIVFTCLRTVESLHIMKARWFFFEDEIIHCHSISFFLGCSKCTGSQLSCFLDLCLQWLVQLINLQGNVTKWRNFVRTHSQPII